MGVGWRHSLVALVFFFGHAIALDYSTEGGGGGGVAALEKSTKVLSRNKRSLIFPTGSTLGFEVALYVPITALSATGLEGDGRRPSSLTQALISPA